MYKDQKAAFWTAEEVDLAQDIKDWEKLSQNEKHFWLGPHGQAMGLIMRL